MRVRTLHHHLFGKRIGSSMGSLQVGPDGVIGGLTEAQAEHFARLGWDVLPEPVAPPEPTAAEPVPVAKAVPEAAPVPAPTAVREPAPVAEPEAAPPPAPAPEPAPAPVAEVEPAAAPAPAADAEPAPAPELDRDALVARAKALGLKVGAHKAETIARMVAEAEAAAAEGEGA